MKRWIAIPIVLLLLTTCGDEARTVKDVTAADADAYAKQACAGTRPIDGETVQALKLRFDTAVRNAASAAKRSSRWDVLFEDLRQARAAMDEITALPANAEPGQFVVLDRLVGLKNGIAKECMKAQAP